MLSKLVIQNRFHLLLKVILHSKFIAKNIYRSTPKTTATQPSTVVIDGKSLSVECCLEPKDALWRQVTV